MVQTIKFSQFSNVNLNNSANKLVGVAPGVNFQVPETVSWTTATRPSSPYDGLLGYNTDLTAYEFWNLGITAWVQLASSDNPPPLLWNNITGTSVLMVPGNGYVTNNSSQVVLTLPTLCNFGVAMAISGLGSGGWQLLFNPGQNVILGNLPATPSSGSLTSTNQYDQIELLCSVQNTTFIVRSSMGNIDII